MQRAENWFKTSFGPLIRSAQENACETQGGYAQHPTIQRYMSSQKPSQQVPALQTEGSSPFKPYKSYISSLQTAFCWRTLGPKAAQICHVIFAELAQIGNSA